MVTVVLLEELLFRSLLVGGMTPLLPGPLLVLAWASFLACSTARRAPGAWPAPHWRESFWARLFLLAGSILLPSIAHYVANMIQVSVAYRVRRHPCHRPLVGTPRLN